MNSTPKLQKERNFLSSPKSTSKKSANLQKQTNKENANKAEKTKIKKSKSTNAQLSLSTDTETDEEPETQKEKIPKKSESRKFAPYWTKEQVEKGLAKEELFKGSIRIPLKNNRIAYVSNKDPTQSDYLIPTAVDRNRALEGDVVVIQVKPKSEWQRDKKTAAVVYILEKIHTRIAVGLLHTMEDHEFAKFVPCDYRIPKIRIIVKKDCPKFYAVYMRDYKDRLHKAKITTWNDTDHAVGTIMEEIGKVGELPTEVKAIIIVNDLDTVTFPEDSPQSVSITEEAFSSEVARREDLRKKCIFTIDPLSAHDVDDAISCKKLNNGNLEVGVHISDVSFYLKEGTPLDKLVSKKATSAYLMDQVLHMLPKELRTTCSLLPGCDKIAFSIFWEMTLSGEIIKQRIARSVINSCCQLAYEHAQAFIENPSYAFQLPQIFGGFTYTDLSRSINYLHRIATNLRSKRFANGALNMSNIKLEFKLDKNTGEPSEFNFYESKEANKLIEEFMILANRTVAEKIIETFPSYAFLRCHDPANEETLKNTQRILKGCNIKVDVSSSKALQDSILKLKRTLGSLEMAVVNYLVVKAMSRAQYLCAQNTENKSTFFHYALSIPAYTHFTSPIRRYADIVVHRLLEASLGYTGKRFWKTKHLVAVATHCNKQRWSAKCAQEDCSRLYLAHYLEKHQPFVQDAIVVNVRKRFFTVLIGATGSIISLYPERMGKDVKYVLKTSKPKKYYWLRIPDSSSIFNIRTYNIHLFAVLKLKISRKDKSSKLVATLL